MVKNSNDQGFASAFRHENLDDLYNEVLQSYFDISLQINDILYISINKIIQISIISQIVVDTLMI